MLLSIINTSLLLLTGQIIQNENIFSQDPRSVKEVSISSSVSCVYDNAYISYKNDNRSHLLTGAAINKQKVSVKEVNKVNAALGGRAIINVLWRECPDKKQKDGEIKLELQVRESNAVRIFPLSLARNGHLAILDTE